MNKDIPIIPVIPIKEWVLPEELKSMILESMQRDAEEFCEKLGKVRLVSVSQSIIEQLEKRKEQSTWHRKY